MSDGFLFGLGTASAYLLILTFVVGVVVFTAWFIKRRIKRRALAIVRTPVDAAAATARLATGGARVVGRAAISAARKTGSTAASAYKTAAPIAAGAASRLTDRFRAKRNGQNPDGNVGSE